MLKTMKSSPLSSPRRRLRTLQKSDSQDAVRTLLRVSRWVSSNSMTAYMPLVCLPIGIVLSTCAMVGIQVIAADAKKQNFFASKFSMANDLISTLAVVFCCLLKRCTAISKG